MQRAASTLTLAVDLAGKVRRPLTFFAAMGFALLLVIPVVSWLLPSEMRETVAIGIAAALPLDILCVLIWGLVRISKNPNAFDDE